MNSTNNRHKSNYMFDNLTSEVRNVLDITMEFKRGILFVRLYGTLNKETVDYFYSDLETVLKDNGIKYVLLNIRNLISIDAYGLEAIKNSYQTVLENKGKLILCGIDNMYDLKLDNNLYQIAEESSAYEIVNI